jgi:diguanylate cyclase (GGDEF)-like protein
VNFVDYQYLITLGIVLIVISTIIYRFILASRQTSQRDEQHERHLREITLINQQNDELHAQIERLNTLNTRYLSFMLKVPTIVQRLNSTAKSNKIISSIEQLINDVIPTNRVDIFLFNSKEKRLEKMSLQREIKQNQLSYDIGQGLIGLAAKNEMVMTREHFSKVSTQHHSPLGKNVTYSMAVPIIFKERLIGVIGIGDIINITGNESQVMRMIADIAGVALSNQVRLSEAKHKANTDPLTGLNNRNYFIQMSQYYVERALKEDSPVSIFIFDIDNFKHYNDTNGHTAGDKLLKELSELTLEVTRKDSTIARYGGEEFIVMLPGVSKKGAYIYAERLREKISLHPFPYREKQPIGFVSISGGVASFPEDGNSIQEVIHLADQVLYQAKFQGKNRVLKYEQYPFDETNENDIKDERFWTSRKSDKYSVHEEKEIKCRPVIDASEDAESWYLTDPQQ